MKIAIASDHGGFALKEILKEKLDKDNIEFQDFGTYSEDSVDFGPFAKKTAEAVAEGKFERGILICGTGIGMSIMANKVKGIRAALVHDVFSAEATRAHNNSNLITMGARVIGEELAKKIIEVWLNTEFDGGRHQRRIDYITEFEKN